MDDTTIKQTVMQKIRDDGMRMRPAWHFGLLTVLWALGIIITVLTIMLISGFIVFSMRQTGALSVAGLGLRGFVPFLGAVPWLLVLIGVLFVIVLELLSRHFAFAYRRPLLVTLGVIIGLALLGGLAFSRAPMHKNFFERAVRGDLPVAGPMYRTYGMSGSGRIHPGIIESVHGDLVTLTTRGGATMSVRVTADTQIDGDILVVDMPVIVLGDRDGASISAIGILRAPDDMLWNARSGGEPIRMHMRPAW